MFSPLLSFFQDIINLNDILSTNKEQTKLIENAPILNNLLEDNSVDAEIIEDADIIEDVLEDMEVIKSLEDMEVRPDISDDFNKDNDLNSEMLESGIGLSSSTTVSEEELFTGSPEIFSEVDDSVADNIATLEDNVDDSNSTMVNFLNSSKSLDSIVNDNNHSENETIVEEYQYVDADSDGREIDFAIQGNHDNDCTFVNDDTYKD